MRIYEGPFYATRGRAGWNYGQPLGLNLRNVGKTLKKATRILTPWKLTNNATVQRVLAPHLLIPAGLAMVVTDAISRQRANKIEQQGVSARAMQAQRLLEAQIAQDRAANQPRVYASNPVLDVPHRDPAAPAPVNDFPVYNDYSSVPQQGQVPGGYQMVQAGGMPAWAPWAGVGLALLLGFGALLLRRPSRSTR